MTKKKKITNQINDKQAVKKKMSREFDHEFANEPLSASEKHHNKKTKKRQ